LRHTQTTCADREEHTIAIVLDDIRNESDDGDDAGGGTGLDRLNDESVDQTIEGKGMDSVQICEGKLAKNYDCVPLNPIFSFRSFQIRADAMDISARIY
jgi:hypothetical protein